MTTNCDDLWRGHGLNPDTWPDIEQALKLAQNELASGLTYQSIGQIKKADRWLTAVAEVLSEKVKRAEKEIEEWRNG